MSETPKLSPDLLDILRCPVGVKMDGDDPGQLTMAHDGMWLVCEDSGYKYPVRNAIPHLLPSEGEKWKDTPVDQLPVPPPPVEDAD
jgi:uncharacterized protein YbaR (Trm112 family)